MFSVYVKKDLWVTILLGLHLAPNEFVKTHAPECLSLVKTGDKLSEVRVKDIL